jgi:excinuclease ABC subunit C
MMGVMPAPAPVVRLLPDEPGVYRFRTARDRVLYIGRAGSLRRRVASYWGDLRDRRHLRRMVPQIERVEAVVCASAHEAAWFERNLLERRMASWNRAAGGAENPLWIRLDATAARPGLRAVHVPRSPDHAGYFGPYLGGLKTRRAVAALHRLLPLAYAGNSLTASQREMAALLKVDPADRDSMIAATAAILDRRPDAVLAARSVLEQRRDRAAEKLAFELASKIQQEVDALAWVTAVQRVTRADALDLQMCGRADGVLVRFAMHGGRLDTWTTENAGTPTADDTPAEWREFVATNAALAARLSTT